MNIAVMLMHIDCPARTEDAPSPVKMQLIGRNNVLYGRCVGCNTWVTIGLEPVDPQPIAVESDIVLDTGEK